MIMTSAAWAQVAQQMREGSDRANRFLKAVNCILHCIDKGTYTDLHIILLDNDIAYFDAIDNQGEAALLREGKRCMTERPWTDEHREILARLKTMTGG